MGSRPIHPIQYNTMKILRITTAIIFALLAAVYLAAILQVFPTWSVFAAIILWILIIKTIRNRRNNPHRQFITKDDT